jgi:hypothetical protein
MSLAPLRGTIAGGVPVRIEGAWKRDHPHGVLISDNMS